MHAAAQMRKKREHPKTRIELQRSEEIQRLGREYEQKITNEYLINIQEIYFDYLKKQSDFPALIIDIRNKDFKNDKQIFKKIKKMIFKKYEKGIHYLDLINPVA